MPPSERPTASRSDGSTQRQHILSTALSLMSQQGVDGTSMRNLATATGLNVASLYHYFPSKQDLLVAVLEERGIVENLAAASEPSLDPADASGLADLLNDFLQSMLVVEDFVRLMMGEVIRGDDTAHAVGIDLFAATQASLEAWLGEHLSLLPSGGEPAAMARMLRSLLVGLFFEHVAGVLDSDDDPATVFRTRAEEVAALLEDRGPG